MRSESAGANRSDRTPQHVAIIMDGNGRWAKAHRLPRIEGHRKGTRAVREIVTFCREAQISYLTLYAFSDENWKRPRAETAALMTLLRTFLITERRLLTKHDVRLRAIGDITKLPRAAARVLQETMDSTRHHKSMTLVLALSYGGRDEIVRAVRKIADDVLDRKLKTEEIDENLVSSYLDTAGIPDPDLLIRTSGEMRLSGFLPWQTTYTELFVTSVLWPDFGRDEMNRALSAYKSRERRFGLTSEQLPKLRAVQ